MNFKEIDYILMNNSVVRSNYNILNPINKLSEFKKFQADKTYNPQFKYHSFDADFHIEKLENLKIPLDSKLGIIFQEVREHLLLEARALKAIGTSEFNTTGLFSPVRDEVVLKAKKILSKPKPQEVDEEKTITSQELGLLMEDKLQKYGCNDWTITFSKHAAARASVSASHKTITIKENELFSSSDAKKLIVHEIGTHVLRALNGSKQEYKIFSIGLPNYLATEEGLAGYNERLNGIAKESTIYNYALSALITHLCSRQSFVEVYNQVRKYYSEDWDCFKAVARPKRGISDTSKPGGYLKDHCYLEGMMLIQEFAKNNGDFKKLYTAKIGIQHLDLVDEEILKPASVLPDFIN